MSLLILSFALLKCLYTPFSIINETGEWNMYIYIKKNFLIAKTFLHASRYNKNPVQYIKDYMLWENFGNGINGFHLNFKFKTSKSVFKSLTAVSVVEGLGGNLRKRIDSLTAGAEFGASGWYGERCVFIALSFIYTLKSYLFANFW